MGVKHIRLSVEAEQALASLVTLIKQEQPGVRVTATDAVNNAVIGWEKVKRDQQPAKPKDKR